MLKYIKKLREEKKTYKNISYIQGCVDTLDMLKDEYLITSSLLICLLNQIKEDIKNKTSTKRVINNINNCLDILE